MHLYLNVRRSLHPHLRLSLTCTCTCTHSYTYVCATPICVHAYTCICRSPTSALISAIASRPCVCLYPCSSLSHVYMRICTCTCICLSPASTHVSSRIRFKISGKILKKLLTAFDLGRKQESRIRQGKREQSSPFTVLCCLKSWPNACLDFFALYTNTSSGRRENETVVSPSVSLMDPLVLCCVFCSVCVCLHGEPWVGLDITFLYGVLGS